MTHSYGGRWPKRQHYRAGHHLHLTSPLPTDFTMSATSAKLNAAILIVSETVSKDPSADKCIPILKEVFRDLGKDQWNVSEIEIVSDSVLAIQTTVRRWTDSENPINLIVTSGGTGFATKDVTPEVRLSYDRTKDWALIKARQSHH